MNILLAIFAAREYGIRIVNQESNEQVLATRILQILLRIFAHHDRGRKHNTTIQAAHFVLLLVPADAGKVEDQEFECIAVVHR